MCYSIDLDMKLARNQAASRPPFNSFVVSLAIPEYVAGIICKETLVN